MWFLNLRLPSYPDSPLNEFASGLQHISSGQKCVWQISTRIKGAGKEMPCVDNFSTGRQGLGGWRPARQHKSKTEYLSLLSKKYFYLAFRSEYRYRHGHTLPGIYVLIHILLLISYLNIYLKLFMLFCDSYSWYEVYIKYFFHLSMWVHYVWRCLQLQKSQDASKVLMMH